MSGARIGAYEIVRTLGRGGMAVVYEVERVGTRTRFALKLIEDADPDVVTRFRREAEVLERLRDVSGIVRLRDQGAERGRPFIVLELATGGSFESALATASRDAALRTLVSVARTVHAAHERGVVHRDLKPANVLLDAEQKPLVTDFGIAKDLGLAALTRTGATLGTAEYMAPEQLDHAKAVDRRADVYALGAILYRILTGVTPFPSSGVQLAKSILLDAPEPPSTLAEAVTPELEQLCLDALEKDPEDRPATAADFAERLERGMDAGPGAHARALGPLAFALVAVVALAVAVASRPLGGRAISSAASPSAAESGAPRDPLDAKIAKAESIASSDTLRAATLLREVADELARKDFERAASVALEAYELHAGGALASPSPEIATILRRVAERALEVAAPLPEAVVLARRELVLARFMAFDADWSKTEDARLLEDLWHRSHDPAVKAAALPWAVAFDPPALSTARAAGTTLATIDALIRDPTSGLAKDAPARFELLAELLFTEPDSGLLLFHLGVAAAALGKAPLAEHALNRAISRLKDATLRGEALRSRALARVALGEREAAVADLREARKAQPSVATCVSLAQALFDRRREGDPREAADLREAQDALGSIRDFMRPGDPWYERYARLTSAVKRWEVAVDVRRAGVKGR